MLSNWLPPLQWVYNGEKYGSVSQFIGNFVSTCTHLLTVYIKAKFSVVHVATLKLLAYEAETYTWLSSPSLHKYEI